MKKTFVFSHTIKSHTTCTAIHCSSNYSKSLLRADTDIRLTVPQTVRARISHPVSRGQRHPIHLTLLERFSWPGLACMFTKVA